ncbi:Zinc finger C-x8-C-x5-C-x3-H type (and similar) [Novymonas esmeraldas]|uniref:Zinc finger C-x8-C-x5-C-x3-H type (And similar) n=1 Tax=Novymonas esmeraldas TaxID=1808958 RepID=A0AAW0ER78_9TRYP
MDSDAPAALSPPPPPSLSAELGAALSEYVGRVSTSPPPFSVAEAMHVLSSFTGIPVHRAASALGCTAGANVGEAVTVSEATLHAGLEVLLRTVGDAEVWWDMPGVTLSGVPDAVSDIVGAVADRKGVAEQCSHTPPQPRSHRPPLPWSTSHERTDVSLKQLSLRPTLNSWGGRGVSTRSGTVSVPSSASPRCGSASVSLERVVAAALGELDALVDEEQCSILFHPDRRPSRLLSDASNEWDRCCTPGDGSRRVRGDALRSPSPVLPAHKPVENASRQPAPPTSTLAELDRFVQRGKTQKVCRQFVQMGRCAFGARCLYHHVCAAPAGTSVAAPLPLPPPTMTMTPLQGVALGEVEPGLGHTHERATAQWASVQQARSIHRLFDSGFVGGPPPPSASVSAHPPAPCVPTTVPEMWQAAAAVRLKSPGSGCCGGGGAASASVAASLTLSALTPRDLAAPLTPQSAPLLLWGQTLLAPSPVVATRVATRLPQGTPLSGAH